MGLARTPWHVLLAALLNQRGSRRYDVQSELPLSAEPLRVDYVFRRRDSGDDESATTLKNLWKLLTKEALVEFKSIGRPYRSTNLDRFVAYLHVYYADYVAQLEERTNLSGVLLVTSRSKSLNADATALGLSWHDLGGGYWKLLGGPFALFAVELDVVAVVEDDDVLRWFVRKQPRTLEGRQWLGTQLGAKEIAMQMNELEGYDEIIQQLLETLAPEQRLAGLAPERVLAMYAPEQRLAGLAPDQVPLTFPDDVLRALSDDYLDKLPEATRAAIRKRIGR